MSKKSREEIRNNKEIEKQMLRAKEIIEGFAKQLMKSDLPLYVIEAIAHENIFTNEVKIAYAKSKQWNNYITEKGKLEKVLMETPANQLIPLKDVKKI